MTVRDWLIVFEAFPTPAKFRREPPERLIASGPVTGGPVDDVERLRAAIKRKCAHYPALDEPLVLAVLSMSTFAERSAFEQALLGSHAYQFQREDPRSASLVRMRNGAWMTGRRASGTNVCGALTATHLVPWQLTKQLPVLWRNPWAELRFEADLPFAQALATEDGGVTYLDGTLDAGEIFGLAGDWPGPRSR